MCEGLRAPGRCLWAVGALVISNLAWDLRSYALGQAVQDGLLASVRVIHGRPWEVRQFWGLSLDDVVRRALEMRGVAAGME